MSCGGGGGDDDECQDMDAIIASHPVAAKLGVKNCTALEALGACAPA